MFENRGGLWVIKPNRPLLIGLCFAMVLISLVQVGLVLTNRPVRTFQVMLDCGQTVLWILLAAMNLRIASREAKANALADSRPKDR